MAAPGWGPSGLQFPGLLLSLPGYTGLLLQHQALPSVSTGAHLALPYTPRGPGTLDDWLLLWVSLCISQLLQVLRQRDNVCVSLARRMLEGRRNHLYIHGELHSPSSWISEFIGLLPWTFIVKSHPLEICHLEVGQV